MLTGWELWIGLVVVAAGALVQGVIGFGFALLAVPLLTLVRPEAIPAAPLFLAFPMTAWMAWRERHGIDWRGVAGMSVGRIGGTVLGALLLARLDGNALSVFVGVALLVAVALQSWRPGRSKAGPDRVAPPEAGGQDGRPGRVTRLVAGFVSGAMSTTVAIGGPAMAVAYNRTPGPRLRPTLAAAFLVGLFMSLAAVAAVGQVHTADVVLALVLLPGLVLGLVAARPLAARITGPWLRVAVLGAAALFGVVAIVRGLTAG